MPLWRKKKPPVAPGDDVCAAPPPLRHDPPPDRFCDLVLTGGVASGVVYPWAIVEIARAFRFREIGGTSVGAMAAALAAASEYGRSTGIDAPFEALRRIPAALGEGLPDGRTRMLSLFQANPRGKRLIALWGRLGRGSASGGEESLLHAALRIAWEVIRAYRVPIATGALVLLAMIWLLVGWPGTGLPLMSIFVLALCSFVLGAVLGLVWAAWIDIRDGLIANGYGLCKGGTLDPPGPEGKRPGISEWLHEGIQLCAGLEKSDRPLTFRDLWNAPAYPGAACRPCGPEDPPSSRSINLEVITTNATHGRPYRLPLGDETSWLYFRKEEWQDYFPADVLDALVRASRPYTPRSKSDPPAGPNTRGLLELPSADLPIVVAARLSLSFPTLFSAVPLWAVDYEAPLKRRTLRRCQFTDGGVSSNFPIHLFDAALPSRPTFGLWLDEKCEHRPGSKVWLPRRLDQGWADEWKRFDPLSKVQVGGAGAPQDGTPGPVNFVEFVGAIAKSALDWQDRTSFQLPHVRNRVARLRLRKGEGGLHIGMPREQILLMAHSYGTVAGKQFVRRYCAPEGEVSRAWDEHRWVRLALLVAGLKERLNRLSASASWSIYAMPMDAAIRRAEEVDPVGGLAGSKPDKAQADSLALLLDELERLERMLAAAPAQSTTLVPEPELRLRAPL
jgi:predicted acylesterase/phospholipase RssA